MWTSPFFFWRIYFDFFSRSVLFLFAFLFIGSFVAHFIVFLSHEMLAGFLSNKKRHLIWVVATVNGKIGSGFFSPPVLIVFVCNCQNLSQFTNRVPVESSILADFANYHFKSFNGNPNGSRKIIMHGSIWTQNSKSSKPAEFALFQLFIAIIPSRLLCQM